MFSFKSDVQVDSNCPCHGTIPADRWSYHRSPYTVRLLQGGLAWQIAGRLPAETKATMSEDHVDESIAIDVPDVRREGTETCSKEADA